MRAPLRALVAYLRDLNAARAVLWCYLIWYLGALIPCFDPSPTLWLSSLGISVIIGTGLYLSTAYAGPTKTQLAPFQIFRLYLMPLCVSSFAALIKGHGFVLVLHPTLAGNLRPLFACAVFLSLVRAAKRFGPAKAPVASVSVASG
jgi:hypothetical protein